MTKRNEDDKIVMEISKTLKECFVIESHDTFKNIILGYQKCKTTPLRSKPMKFNNNPSVSTEKRSLSESDQWGEFEIFRNFNFKKVDRFNIIYLNFNDYIGEICRMQQEHLERESCVESSSGKRKWVNFEQEYDDAVWCLRNVRAWIY